MRIDLLKRIVLAGMFLTAAAQGESITVSAAISLQDALKTIAADYQHKTQQEIVLEFGPSGRLAEQIKQGAPVDIFISAASEQVERLVAAGAADGATVRIVAQNRLVLIAPAGAKNPPGGFEDLADARFKRVAIGEPRTVPAGDYAMQVLQNLKLTEALKDRLIYGANVRQVLDYVERGEVEAGIVYKTDAIRSADKVKLVATADGKLHKPIEYPAVIVSRSSHHEAARRFLEYLASEPARERLTTYGFTSAQP